MLLARVGEEAADEVGLEAADEESTTSRAASFLPARLERGVAAGLLRKMVGGGVSDVTTLDGGPATKTEAVMSFTVTLAVTVTSWVLVSVAGSATGVVEAAAVLVTVMTLITVTVAGSLFTSGDEDIVADCGEVLEPVDAGAEADVVVVSILAADTEDVAAELLSGIAEVDKGAAPSPRKGVGMTVELGPGGGIPPGYESTKISS